MARTDTLYEQARARFDAIVEEKGLDEVARELGFSVSMCSHVRNGTKGTSLMLAAAIQDRYAIPAVWWARKKRKVA